MSVPGLLGVWENLQEQCLYEKFLKQRNSENEEAYKMYKNLFEKLKNQAKKLYFQNKLKKWENNIKNTRKIIEKSRVQNDSCPKNLIIANEEITDKKSIAGKFNSFFVNTGTNLAAKIPHGNTTYHIWIISYKHHYHFSRKLLNRGRVQKCFFFTKDK